MSETTVVDSPKTGKSARAANILSKLGLVLGAICIVAGIVAGLGARFGLWHFRVGFTILQSATYTAFAVIALSLIGVILAQKNHLRRARTTGLLGLVLGLVAAGPPLYQVYTAKTVPPIHDISTDTANPPKFVAVVALRKKDDNSLEPSAEVAAKQQEAYPDIKPLIVAVPPEQALKRAETAARAMGWDVDAVDPAALRMEATATTLLFGFKDDIVVRVAPAEGASGSSRIDIRSASRVGRSDIGVNARRIRAYIKQIEATS
jgi:uncharacterized protein (DUF1499 family)